MGPIARSAGDGIPAALYTRRLCGRTATSRRATVPSCVVGGLWVVCIDNPGVVALRSAPSLLWWEQRDCERGRAVMARCVRTHSWWTRTFPFAPPWWVAIPLGGFFCGAPLWVVIVGLVT